MIVVDASIIVDFVLALPPRYAEIRARILAEQREIVAPHLLDAEVGQVLRRFVLAKKLAPRRAVVAIDDFLALPIQRYPHRALLRRAFELRDNATLYDALYLALAEALAAPLLTRDAGLAAVPGHRARVEVLA